MPDCPNAEIRDLLPDYAHGALGGPERTRVEAHLATCAACREELALVRAVRASRVDAAVPDVARIVAALPRPSAAAAPARAGVVPLDGHRRRRTGGLPWRRIAGMAAVVVGAVGIGVIGVHGERAGGSERAVVLQPSADAPMGAGASAATASAQPAVVARGDTPATPGSPGVQRPPVRARIVDASDAVGALGGIASGATEDELEALIGALESLSGIPEVENSEGEESARGGGVR